ncbi:MAG: Hsp70 family protein, partial [Desulfococcus multivorans]|nr:Hsp70 family protein [Desulfococcus multivorans]
ESTKVLITHGGERIKLQFERKVFERLTQDLLERTIALTHDMLEEAVKKGYKHFDEIILVGGSTRMPMVVQRIKKEFGIEPKLFDPDEAVAKGAAIYGWKLFLQDEVREHISQKTGKKIHELEDFSALDLDDIIEEVEQLVANDTGYSIEDIQNAKLKIKNVTSKSFGVVAHDQNGNEIVYNLILKNNDVPVNTKKTFGTAVDNQEIASIQIMENEENDVVATLENSILIGTAVLNLPPDIAANTPIEIIFKLNREGRMEITAEEMSDAHRSVSVTIETRSVIRGKEFEEAKARAKHIVVI